MKKDYFARYLHCRRTGRVYIRVDTSRIPSPLWAICGLRLVGFKGERGTWTRVEDAIRWHEGEAKATCGRAAERHMAIAKSFRHKRGTILNCEEDEHDADDSSSRK